MSDNTTTTPPANGLAGAGDRIREASKWLLTAFGAVGVVVVAGVALGDVGRVAPSDRWLAVTCVAVAVIGVGIAILAAGSVLTQGFVTLEEAATANEVKDPALLAGLPNVAELRRRYLTSLTQSRESAEALYTHLGGDATAPNFADTTKALTKKAESATAMATYYDDQVHQVLTRQNYAKVAAAYDGARIRMALGTGLAVVGILGFVLVTASPAQSPVVGKVPVAVTVTVDPIAQDRVHALLGAQCELTDLPGTAIATEGEAVVVAFAKHSDCAEGLVRFAPGEATVVQKG